jgi:transcription initiation factor TFIID subunit 6
LSLYFDKIQTAILDDNPDEEVDRLRRAALASVTADPGIHQLVPYFVNFISNQVTHHLDDVFVLRQMMELTNALIANKTLFLDSYASPLSSPALTCLLGRRLGSDDAGEDANVTRAEQYRLREFSASIVGELARRFSTSNALLRSKLTRTCLKHFLDKDKPPAVTYGAIKGLLAAGGPETIRHIVLDTLKSVDEMILEPLRQASLNNPSTKLEYDTLLMAIVDAVSSISSTTSTITIPYGGAQSRNPLPDSEMNALIEYVGPNVAHRVAALRDQGLVKRILERSRSTD